GAALATYTEHLYTNAVLEDDAYRAPLPAETHTYQLIHVQPEVTLADVTTLFRFDEMKTKVAAACDGQHDVPYEDVDATGSLAGQLYRRLLERTRTFYRADDMGGTGGDPNALLPLGRVETLALPGSSYKLALTPGLLSQIYQRGQSTLLTNPAAVLGSL